MSNEAGSLEQTLRSELLSLRPPAGPPPTWSERYFSSLASNGFSSTAISVLRNDCEYIYSRGLAAGTETVDQVRTGLVMGSVQSGKTASMLGILAMAVDDGVDVVIVLTGTRTSLWHQTRQRIVKQLLARPTGVGIDFLFSPSAEVESWEQFPPSEMYALNGSRVRRVLGRKQPVLITAMKNVHHLRALRLSLQPALRESIARLEREVRVLVIDDEADDGSILDARAETGMDPSLDDLKQIPRSIVDLWSAGHDSLVAFDPSVRVSYVAYTATPQANLVQSDHNPLAPRDFVAALRTPFDVGVISPRSLTFREPQGLAKYYIGGEAFYRSVGGAVCKIVGGTGADVQEGVRAYLVACAVRLWRERGKLLPSEMLEAEVHDEHTARQVFPSISSMLVHTSGTVDSHFRVASEILAWASNTPVDAALSLLRARDAQAGFGWLASDVATNDGLWRRWVDEYRASAATIESRFDEQNFTAMSPTNDWDAIKQVLVSEVMPFVRVAVLNSDAAADDRPKFELEYNGKWIGPKDQFTIFVAGNVLSRGLTLEGLLTSVFLRTSADPLADTQMQMQRWFGYRGSEFDLTRVFLTAAQYDLFSSYHNADQGIRQQVISAMNFSGDAPTPIVVAGIDYAATGKIANLANVPLCPGANPFIRWVNDDLLEDPNLSVVERVFRDHSSVDLHAGGVLRGRILERPFSLAEAADLLDSFDFASKVPLVDQWTRRRWESLEAAAQMDAQWDPEGLLPFLRVPALINDAFGGSFPAEDPHMVAAYLRLWAAALSRRVPGLVATNSPRAPWSLLNLEQKTRTQPRFYIGLRYGQGRSLDSGGLRGPFVQGRAMERTIIDHRLVATWGSRNPSGVAGAYLGDQLFDFHLHGGEAVQPSSGPAWRAEGQPGQILLHVVESATSEALVTALGISIPLGGPDQFAAWT